MAPPLQRQVARQSSEGAAVAENVELDALLGPILGLSPELEDIEAYSDFTVICDDDGTELKLHRAIVCPQVAAMKAGLQDCFKEGKEKTYHLPGKDSKVVALFFDIIYRKFGRLKSVTTKSSHDFDAKAELVFDMARVYCVADELQASSVMKYASAWLKTWMCSAAHTVCMAQAMEFIYENSHRKSDIFDDYLQEVAKHLTVQQFEKNWEPIAFIEKHEELQKSLAMMLSITGPLSHCRKHFTPNEWRKLLSSECLRTAMIDAVKTNKTLKLMHLWSMDAFRTQVFEAKMEQVVVEKLLGIARGFEPGGGLGIKPSSIIQTELMWKGAKFCHECRSILLSEIFLEECPKCRAKNGIGSIKSCCEVDGVNGKITNCMVLEDDKISTN